MIIPLIASIAGAANQVYSKISLSKDKIDYKVFTVLSFLIIFCILLIASPFFFEMPMFTLEIVPYFIALIVVGGTWNLLSFYGMSHDKLSEYEPLISTAPLFSVILAVLVYSEERNLKLIVFSIIAGLALIWNHVEKKHLVFNKYSLAILASSLLIAIENIILKKLLTVFDPINLYFYRVTVILIILFIIFRPNPKQLAHKKLNHTIVANMLITIQAIFIFWSFAAYGIIKTVLILNLIPVVVYIASVFILKEKMSKKNIITAAVVLLCVIAVQVL